MQATGKRKGVEGSLALLGCEWAFLSRAPQPLSRLARLWYAPIVR